jgi:hypothetical protein
VHLIYTRDQRELRYFNNKITDKTPGCMKQLTETWFIEGFIDFELKKYTVLAYLQEVNKHFNENKLYPQLADVIFHYNNLVSFKHNKDFLKEHFPKRLNEVKLQQLQLVYQQMIEDDELMKELEDIIGYSIDTMKGTISSGTEIYHFIEENLQIMPVGIVPLKTDEGYMLLSSGNVKEIQVYQYSISIFEKHDEVYRGIRTEYISSLQKNFVNTYGQIKSDLIRYKTNLPNPAVYSIESTLCYPVDESLLPIAKRSLVKYIMNTAA